MSIIFSAATFNSSLPLTLSSGEKEKLLQHSSFFVCICSEEMWDIRVDKTVKDFLLDHHSCFHRHLTKRSVTTPEFYRDSCTETDADDFN